MGSRICAQCGVSFFRAHPGKTCSRACFQEHKKSKNRTAAEPPPVDGAKWIHLTRGRFALVDVADFERVSAHSWSSGIRDAYAISRIIGNVVTMHRFLMAPERGVLVDHINGDGLDNRRSNMRFATYSQNLQNKRAVANSAVPFKGVMRTVTGPYKKIVFTANIREDGKKRRIGTFRTPEDAARAYDGAARILHGEFARLNFPREGEQPAISSAA